MMALSIVRRPPIGVEEGLSHEGRPFPQNHQEASQGVPHRAPPRPGLCHQQAQPAFQSASALIPPIAVGSRPRPWARFFIPGLTLRAKPPSVPGWPSGALGQRQWRALVEAMELARGAVCLPRGRVPHRARRRAFGHEPGILKALVIAVAAPHGRRRSSRERRRGCRRTASRACRGCASDPY